MKNEAGGADVTLGRLRCHSASHRLYRTRRIIQPRARLQHRATTSESGRHTWGYALALLALSPHDEDGAPIRRTEEAALLRLDTAGDAASTRSNPAYAYDDAAAGGVKCVV